MWHALLTRLGIVQNAERAEPETADALIAKTAELRGLLRELGYDTSQDEAVDRIMAELKASIRAELTDYTAFRSAIAAAVIRRRNMPTCGGFALLDSLGAAGDQAAALALLNADPIRDQVPFIEQIPVLKNGELTWRSPVDHSLIRRRPADLPRFVAKLAELEAAFSEPRPGRVDAPRLEVLDAIARLRREVDRDRSYLPTPLLFLETKLTEYKTKSLKPGSVELTRTLLTLLESLAELNNTLETGGGKGAAGRIAGEASRYLATPQIQIPWLTSYILGLMLHPGVTATVGGAFRARDVKTMQLIRTEIRSGHYDAREEARRLRRMEALGLHVSSLVYPLLRLRVLRLRAAVP